MIFRRHARPSVCSYHDAVCLDIDATRPWRTCDFPRTRGQRHSAIYTSRKYALQHAAKNETFRLFYDVPNESFAPPTRENERALR